jgi:type II secretory ATPase GspE/PulE/Tfp pilus assembly ATPase PilB-like protein/CheY-like chemotaxis protein
VPGGKERHWLVRVAAREGLCSPDAIDIRVDTPTADAWSAVADASGLSHEELAVRVARAMGLQVAEFTTAEPNALNLVPLPVARQYNLFPLREDDRRLIVATSEPLNLEAEQALSFASGRTVVMEVAPPSTVDEAVNAQYAPDRAVESMLAGLDTEVADSVRLVEEIEPESVDAHDLQTGPVVQLVNLMLRDAILQGASDIHAQPSAAGAKIRFRVDGLLRTYAQVPIRVLTRIVSRIKVLGKMDIADHLRPQDGRARISMEGRFFDLRISTVPTRDSEKAVIRVLDTGGAPALDALGMAEPEVRQLRKLLSHRDGIIVVTGPTGSGKTTTLYGVLREVETEDVNVMTVEDPVEYELPGLTQIQVEPKRGVTFASALRAILRQDPDVIFIGEIRDRETAEIAVQASLTGHVVLATLHANDALGSIQRMLDLGLERSAIVESLRGALAQRLARRICASCGGVADGCKHCGFTGFRGRFPVAEVFVMTPELQQAVLRGVPPAELHATAVAAGMRPMQDVGVERIASGETTTAEIERVLGESSTPPPPTAPFAHPGDGAEPVESPHVLLADDDGATRTMARAVLEGGGFRCSEAADGEDVLALLKLGSEFDLVVLDLEMPAVGGREVLQHLRATVATASLPVIVLTGTGVGEETELELMDSGADDYLLKPIDPPRLLARVRAVIRRANA